MNKVLFVSRDLPESRSLQAHLIRRTNMSLTTVLEAGKKAKIRKLKREFRKGKIHFVKFAFIDSPLLLLFRSATSPRAAFKVKKSDLQGSEILEVDDINDDEFLGFVKNLQPDLILSYGTSIYKPETLLQLRAPVVNIHDGVLPQYRNVHTDFWAFYLRDADGLGASMFYVDEGIDSGAVIDQRVCPQPFPRKFRHAREKLHELRTSMAVELCSRFGSSAEGDSNYRIVPFQQPTTKRPDEGKGRMWPSPTSAEIILAVCARSRFAARTQKKAERELKEVL